jgi:hypothetical protein
MHAHDDKTNEPTTQRIKFDPAWFVLSESEMNVAKYNVPDPDTKPKVPVKEI